MRFMLTERLGDLTLQKQKKMKRVSLNDLAKALKVSKTLVSLVLNGKGDAYGINAQTQKRVMRKAKKMNYRPNQIARGLRRGRSNVIAVVVADIANPFYSRISRSIEDYAAKQGYNIIVCSTEEDASKEKALIEMLVNEQNVSGIIVSTTQESAAQLSQLQKSEIPVVLVDRKAGNGQIDYVGVNNFQGAYDATKHLLSLGYKRIGLLQITPSYLSSIRERTKGYQAALKDSGIKTGKDLIREIEFANMREDVRHHVKELLAPPRSAEALFVLNSNLAAYALEYINESGLRIPQDVAVVSFDDVEFFRFTYPPVTAVAQPLEEIGKKSVELVVNRIKKSGTAIKAKSVELKPEFIVRRSCGAFLVKK